MKQSASKNAEIQHAHWGCRCCTEYVTTHYKILSKSSVTQTSSKSESSEEKNMRCEIKKMHTQNNKRKCNTVQN